MLFKRLHRMSILQSTRVHIVYYVESAISHYSQPDFQIGHGRVNSGIARVSPIRLDSNNPRLHQLSLISYIHSTLPPFQLPLSK